MEQKKNNKSVYGVIIVIIMAILGFSVLMMSRAGLNQFKAMRAELELYEDSLKVIDAKVITHSGAEVANAVFKGKIIVAHFYDPSCNDCNKEIWKELERVQMEYKKKTTRRVQILSHSLQPDSIPHMKALLETHNIDTSNWKIITADSSELAALITKGYRLEPQKAKNTLALLDINGFLVNYYDANKVEEVNRMMRHIAMLIPAKQDRRKIKFEREKNLYN
jgi:cytochrome oxidase Cu insertion factor (SCO1/SenC/PrrC family)